MPGLAARLAKAKFSILNTLQNGSLDASAVPKPWSKSVASIINDP